MARTLKKFAPAWYIYFLTHDKVRHEISGDCVTYITFEERYDFSCGRRYYYTIKIKGKSPQIFI